MRPVTQAAAPVISPLIIAAMDAWNEVKSLRLEAQKAVAFQDSWIGLHQLKDACEAYARSYDRAVQIQKLADEDMRKYNVWEKAS